MKPDLSGILLKARRACEQYDGFKELVRAWLESQPYVVEPQFNPEANELLGIIRMREPHPPIWMILLGEFIHNLRSALDHLVWQLVILETGNPPKTKVQFPIFLTEDLYNRSRGGGDFCLNGVGSAGKTFVKSLQPFSTREGTTSPLWHLHELSNWDKHRLIYLTQAFARDPKAGAKVEHVFGVKIPVSGPFQDGAMAWGLMLRPSAVPIEERIKTMDVQFQITIDIAFKEPPVVEGLLMAPILNAIAKRVLEICERADVELFGSSY
jgi:hypothetical protein